MLVCQASKAVHEFVDQNATPKLAKTQSHKYSKLTIGIADGAKDNGPFLNQYTSIQMTEFWHATEYLADATGAIFHWKKQQAQRIDWLRQRCHELKGNSNTTRVLLRAF